MSGSRQLREVVFVDGVRTPFGKAKGQYAETRADDLVIKCIRELMRRNPSLPPERVDEVAVAATTQIGDQGLTIGRTAALLAGLPQSVPGYAIDRMCAGAMTAVTTTASGIAFGAYDVAIAGGVEHMGRHPMGEGVDPNPRILSERIVDPDALVMGKTAENLHDRYPTITKERVDAYAVRSQEKTAAAYDAGKIQPDLVPVAIRSEELGWGLATTDEPMRRGTTMESLAALKTPFRAHGKVTAGNAAGINDGATAALLAEEETARELGLPVKMRLVAYSFVGVEPEVMGAGPIPATEKALKQAGLTIDDIEAFEVNEAFAVQVLAFLEHFGIADDDPRVNPYGGAIAMGHPLASSGVRLMTQLARQFEERPEVRYGLTTMCIGIGMGGTVIWENPAWGASPPSTPQEPVVAAAEEATRPAWGASPPSTPQEPVVAAAEEATR
ncbi:MULTISPECIES: thiolase family protein [unclassified Nocardioides]|uniref:thiolase family protein n=1 Tax=unclassified Nocardioides TaxID=2615069 RepID=UPI0000EB626B|nr:MULTISPECIES: thiolase family protein [unclassified Nocardioides]ABL82355.1 acetyl-CoA acetyltransferase [Nocardioides sp. JS614]